eukprot:6738216-Pyramimonas_sp.AAC.1
MGSASAESFFDNCRAPSASILDKLSPMEPSMSKPPASAMPSSPGITSSSSQRAPMFSPWMSSPSSDSTMAAPSSTRLPAS